MYCQSYFVHKIMMIITAMITTKTYGILALSHWHVDVLLLETFIWKRICSNKCLKTHNPHLMFVLFPSLSYVEETKTNNEAHCDIPSTINILRLGQMEAIWQITFWIQFVKWKLLYFIHYGKKRCHRHYMAPFTTKTSVYIILMCIFIPP